MWKKSRKKKRRLRCLQQKIVKDAVEYIILKTTVPHKNVYATNSKYSSNKMRHRKQNIARRNVDATYKVENEFKEDDLCLYTINKENGDNREKIFANIDCEDAEKREYKIKMKAILGLRPSIQLGLVQINCSITTVDTKREIKNIEDLANEYLDRFQGYWIASQGNKKNTHY